MANATGTGTGAGACPPFHPPDTVACAGGTCVDATTCSCPPGYENAADFVFARTSCALRTDAVVGLAAFLAVCRAIQSIAAVVAAVVFLRRRRAAGTFNSNARKRSNRLTLVLFASSFLDGVCLAAAGALRVQDPSRAWGVDVATTTLFFVGHIFQTVYMGGVFARMVDLLRGTAYVVLPPEKLQSPAVVLFLKWGRLIFAATVGLPFSLSLVCFMCMLSATSDDAMFAWASAFNIFIALTALLGAAATMPWVFAPFLNALKQHVERMEENQINNDNVRALRVILLKFEAIKIPSLIQALNLSVFFLLLGSFRWLQKYEGYILTPLVAAQALGQALTLWLLVPVQSSVAASASSNSGGGKSPRPRLTNIMSVFSGAPNQPSSHAAIAAASSPSGRNVVDGRASAHANGNANAKDGTATGTVTSDAA